MRTIKVTTLSDKRSIYINIDMIGHLYEIEEKDFNRGTKKYTVIGTTTHNNGGFKVAGERAFSGYYATLIKNIGKREPKIFKPCKGRKND